MADTYASYTELAAAEPYGASYDILSTTSNATDWAAIAIHGGGIEPGSGEVAKAVADGLMDYYEFRGLLASGNSRLHVTSTNFDEPVAQDLVARSSRTLSFHGYTGDGTATTALGGLDDNLKPLVSARLTAAGFRVITAPQEISGSDPNNIVNKNRIGAGVQLELSRALRESFFPGGSITRSVRDSGQRTPQFWAYVAAIRLAVQDYLGSQSPPPGNGVCLSDYSARITDRKGAVVADAVALTSVSWSRVLNDTSSASITVAPEGDCCQELGNVRTWGHELRIYRNGTFVWSGPVINAEWSYGSVQIDAADISAWLARRVPHASMTFKDADLTAIASWLIDDGYAPDDPGHSVQVVGLAGIKGGRAYTKNVGQTLDHLGDLADTGIDWTVTGTKFVILPDNFAASLGSVTDEDMPDGLSVAEDGAGLITRWVVAGGSDHDQVGEAGGKNAFYGLLERYEEQSSITDPTSAQAAAQARLSTSSASPVFIDTQQVTLSPEAPVDVNTLVPGWTLDVATTATCRDISQRLKITGVKATLTAGDTAQGVEQVQLTVATTGTGTS